MVNSNINRRSHLPTRTKISIGPTLVQQSHWGPFGPTSSQQDPHCTRGSCHLELPWYYMKTKITYFQSNYCSTSLIVKGRLLRKADVAWHRSAPCHQLHHWWSSLGFVGKSHYQLAFHLFLNLWIDNPNFFHIHLYFFSILLKVMVSSMLKQSMKSRVISQHMKRLTPTKAMRHPKSWSSLRQLTTR